MNYYMIVEPMIKNAYWCNQYIEGIKYEVQRIKGKLVEIEIDHLDEIKSDDSAEVQRPVVIVNCISNTWIPLCLETLNQHHIHPLLLTPFNMMTLASVSTVTLDFMRIFISLCQYLSSAGRSNIALFGLNPISANDVMKKQAFLTFQKSMHGDNFRTEDSVFWNRGSLEECCQQFWENVHAYNSVICANDVVAIKLIRFLKNRGLPVPEEMFVATIGNTILSSRMNPSITVAEFDCFSIGRQAIRMYTQLAKNPELASLTATISGRIIARESTACFAVTPDPTFPNLMQENVNFYADKDVKMIFHLENLLANCEEPDLKIIRGILCEKTYTQLSEELFMTVGTIKYRIRRMLQLSECSTRTELVEQLAKYIDF